MQLNDLIVLCTKLQKRVLDLEKAKSDQAIEIASLKKRVNKLEKRRKFKTIGLKRLKKVGASRRIESSNDSLGAQEDASKQGRRIEDIDADAEVTLVNETQERQDEDLMFDTGVLDDDEVFVDVTTVEKEEQSTQKTGRSQLTTAGCAKPKAKGIVFHDLEKQVSKLTVSVTQPSIKDKGKGIMQEPERPLKRKDQVALDEVLSRNIQAQLDAKIIEEERLERLLAERLQTREREELTDEEKGKLFMELMEKRRKHFAALRALEKRNRPPMGHKRELFDKEKKRVNTFVAMSSEAQESNEKNEKGSEEMLQDIDREDLETLWKLVKIKHGDTRPEDEHERVLLGDFKVMFKPDIRSKVWRDLQGYTTSRILFQPLFDELLNPPSSVDRATPEIIAPIAEVVTPKPVASTGSPSSTTVDQDAPSPSKSQTTPATQSPIISNDVEEENYDLDVAHMNNDPFFGIPILKNVSKTKDHPLDNIIGELARPVSTRLQLHEQALFCYYNVFLTSVEPNNYKDALTQACWIEAMQEELNEFERLEVWELVPCLDKVMVITSKWIYKVKLDELGGILKNKA
ncbi:retrovirus-related pol polyprotein from transposon TNT 1-94 [Tanacetum coccineum]